MRSEASVRSAIAGADSNPDRSLMHVVFLCAAWCDTCREFLHAARRLAAARPEIAFVWLDIEDDEAIVGDVDVDNFPTLAIARGDTVLHFGVNLPHEASIDRLIDEMHSRHTTGTAIPPAVDAMFTALRAIAATT